MFFHLCSEDADCEQEYALLKTVIVWLVVVVFGGDDDDGTQQ